MKSKILLSLAILIASGTAVAQINGLASVGAGTTHVYTYTNSTLVSPSWQVTGGTKSNEIFNPGNYSVTITWGSGPSGGIALIDSSIPVATLSVSIAASLSAPVNGTPFSISATGFTAAWTAVTGATGYRLDVSLNSSFSSFVPGYNNKAVTGLSNAVTGLAANTQYFYRVRATNSTSTSASSDYTWVKTPTLAPVAVNATTIATTSFNANWNSTAGATSYRLDVSLSNTFQNFVSGFQDLLVSGTSKNVTGLTPGQTYHYRVRATNESPVPSANSTTITVVLVPAAPVFNTISSVSTSGFTLNWASVTGAASYRLDISLSLSFSTFISGYNNLSLTGTSRTVSGLTPGTTYHCRIRAVNGSGTSSNSTTLSVAALTVAPIALAPTAITATSFTVHWQTVSGATGYRLDISHSSSFDSFVPGYNNQVVAGTSHGVSGQSMNASYYYRIRAVNASGSSINSNVVKLDLDHNYIKKTTVQKAGLTSVAAVESAPDGDKIVTYEFFDGLGRPSQTVVKKGSPAGEDIVQPFAYDQFGREVLRYLPYTDGSSGWYKENALKDPTTGVYASSKQHQFYQSGGLVAADVMPYSESRFEPSPLNRLLKQGAPGVAWQPDANNSYTSSDRTVKKAYEVVSSATEVRLFTYVYPANSPELLGIINGGTSSASTYYPANSLFRNKTKDEDHNEILEYLDNEGRLVLKRVHVNGSPSTINDSNYASTYYIYNDFGNLACVIPPEASKRLATEYLNAAFSAKETFLRRWAFRYKYDHRGRMIRKIVPGAGQIIMIYDDLDRLVLTQDSVQRTLSPKEWTFTKYDYLSRPVITGRYTNNGNFATVKSVVDASTVMFETYSGGGGAVHGYTNNSFPSISTIDCYSVTYYDKHDTFIAPTGYTYTSQSLSDPETSFAQETVATVNAVRKFGQVTGTLVKNLGNGTMLRNVVYYDQKYRPVQTVNDHQKGKVVASTVLDFSGKIVFTRRTYTVNGVSRYINENPNYDQTGRLLWTKMAINSTTAYIMVANQTYNALGQLVDKKMHSADNGATFKQSVDFSYNIRGWLTKINEPDVATVATGDSQADYFGMELYYDNPFETLSSNRFNGNISAIQWSKGNGGPVRKQSYTFTYDNMNRLGTATHRHYENNGGTWSWQTNNSAFSEVLTYDLNGNINTLVRKGFNGLSLDNLTYGYTGNQLNYVHDTGSATLGFVNGNTGTDDYSYDPNGNLDKDKNKGLSTKGNIKYNFLNLPEEIRKGANEKVKYIYDASGRKLAQEVYNTSGVLVKTTDYIGEMIYENDVLQSIQHAEGRVLPDGSGWEYQYYLKDHLGNVRITFTSKTQTTASTTANFESATNADFQNYSNTTFDLVDHTDAGTTYNKVQWLNGGVNGRVGVARSIGVMPGDEVTISAWVKYMNLGTTPNSNALITSLANAFGVSSGSTGEALKIYNGLNSYALTVPAGDHYNDNEGAPKAFVTILFFDKDYNLIDAAWDQVTTTGAQTSATVKQPPHDLASITAKAPEAGYAFVFVSNEHPHFVDVYFDDVTVSHTPSPIVSVSDYYPFGMQFNSGERTGAIGQNYLYNGKELQDEMALSWYDYGARMYMPEIGRWGVIDPLAEKMRRWTPYNYALDNPVRFIDPDGMLPQPVMNADLDDLAKSRAPQFETMLQTYVSMDQSKSAENSASDTRGVATMNAAIEKETQQEYPKSAELFARFGESGIRDFWAPLVGKFQSQPFIYKELADYVQNFDYESLVDAKGEYKLRLVKGRILAEDVSGRKQFEYFPAGNPPWDIIKGVDIGQVFNPGFGGNSIATGGFHGVSTFEDANGNTVYLVVRLEIITIHK